MLQRGFTPIFILLIAIVISVLIFFGIKDRSLSSLVPTLTVSPTSSPTPSPSLSPSPSPSPKPTVAPTKVPTPKPTLPAVSGLPAAGYSRVNVHTEKGDFSSSIISIDLNSSKMITDSASESNCGDGCPVLALADFVTRNGGFAGVNGTYFCPITYPECAGKTNSFDFPIYNSRLGHWINEDKLFWDSRAIVYTDGSGAHYLQNAKSFGGGLNAGIVNYPGLLDNGNVQIDDNQSGLSDKQKAVGTKVGIGVISQTRVIVVVAGSVNMQQFAYIFKALGATGALNLDTGGSTALYWGGYKAGPGRNIPNAIIFASK